MDLRVSDVDMQAPTQTGIYTPLSTSQSLVRVEWVIAFRISNQRSLYPLTSVTLRWPHIPEGQR